MLESGIIDMCDTNCRIYSIRGTSYWVCTHVTLWTENIEFGKDFYKIVFQKSKMKAGLVLK